MQIQELKFLMMVFHDVWMMLCASAGSKTGDLDSRHSSKLFAAPMHLQHGVFGQDQGVTSFAALRSLHDDGMRLAAACLVSLEDVVGVTRGKISF